MRLLSIERVALMFDLIEDAKVDYENGIAVITFKNGALKKVLDGFIFFNTQYGMNDSELCNTMDEWFECLIHTMGDNLYEMYNYSDPCTWVERDIDIYECYCDVYKDSVEYYGADSEQAKYDKYIRDKALEDIHCFCV